MHDASHDNGATGALAAVAGEGYGHAVRLAAQALVEGNLDEFLRWYGAAFENTCEHIDLTWAASPVEAFRYCRERGHDSYQSFTLAALVALADELVRSRGGVTNAAIEAVRLQIPPRSVR